MTHGLYHYVTLLKHPLSRAWKLLVITGVEIVGHIQVGVLQENKSQFIRR